MNKALRLKPTVRHSPEALKNIHQKVAPHLDQFRHGQIPGYELIAQLVLKEREQTIGKKFWQGPLSDSLRNTFGFPAIDQIAATRIRGCQMIIQQALILWASQNWNMPIIGYKPSPLEMLQSQAKGFRPLTFFFDESIFAEFFEEIHSSFGLVLHDLIHAFKYFTDLKNQMSMAQLYLKIYEPLKTEIPSLDFHEHLDYIVADMNTHPVHSMQTLKAHLLSYLELKNAEDLESWTSSFYKKYGLNHLASNLLPSILGKI